MSRRRHTPEQVVRKLREAESENARLKRAGPAPVTSTKPRKLQPTMTDVERLLLRAAALELGSEEQEEALFVVWRLPMRETVDVALPLLASPVALMRAVAVLALSQCVRPDDQGRRVGDVARVIRRELASLGQEETDVDVMWALAQASCFLPSPVWEGLHPRWAGVDDDDLREAVAYALSAQPTSGTLVSLILDLTHDRVSSVRNWAAFALALKAEEVNDVRVVARLRELIEDPEPDVVAEAARGLALAGDVEGARQAVARYDATGRAREDAPAINNAIFALGQ